MVRKLQTVSAHDRRRQREVWCGAVFRIFFKEVGLLHLFSFYLYPLSFLNLYSYDAYHRNKQNQQYHIERANSYVRMSFSLFKPVQRHLSGPYASTDSADLTDCELAVACRLRCGYICSIDWVAVIDQSYRFCAELSF